MWSLNAKLKKLYVESELRARRKLRPTIAYTVHDYEKSSYGWGCSSVLEHGLVPCEALDSVSNIERWER